MDQLKEFFNLLAIFNLNTAQFITLFYLLSSVIVTFIAAKKYEKSPWKWSLLALLLNYVSLGLLLRKLEKGKWATFFILLGVLPFLILFACAVFYVYVYYFGLF